VDWKAFAENLRNESIISHLSAVDPLSLAGNLYVVASAIVVAGGLLCFRMVKTLATIVGACVIWVLMYYTLPHGGQELKVGDVALFAGVASGVVAVLIYVYLIRD